MSDASGRLVIWRRVAVVPIAASFMIGEPSGHAPRTERRAPVKIELQLAKGAFVQGENIDVDVAITNTGAAPVMAPVPSAQSNAQPLYWLTGPGIDQPIGLSNYS